MMRLSRPISVFHRRRWLWLLNAFAIGAFCTSRLGAEEPPAEPSAKQIEFFEKEIRPLLARRCFECHGPDAERLEGGLLMNSRAALLEGGDTGPAVVPGEPKGSLLIDAINYGDLYEMPPKGKMPAEEIALLTRWVEMGAPWPSGAESGPDPREKFDLQARKESHWAWQPIADPAPPEVKHKDWPLDSIDHFILARLEKEGLRPNPPADARTLARRLYFDLIGLPPTEEQVAEFLLDCQIDPAQPSNGQSTIRVPQSAIEGLVDELLASPHFGERWGRHWLDLVRYAESRGHEFDYHAPNAWEYRDYVIRALNADVPYDQFVVEHIAGDLLEQPRRHPEKGFNESIIATGFWHLGEWVHSPVDIRKDECDRLDNQIDVFGKAFLGMTIACARCHDHKFDAISQRDYYALAGYVQSSAYRLARFETLEHNRRIAEQLRDLRKTSGDELARLTSAAQQPVLEQLDQYLLVAREAIAASRKGKRDGAALRRALAERHQLDADILSAWIDHLAAAKDDADDPLHLWARLALDSNQGQTHLAQHAAAAVRKLGERAGSHDSTIDDANVIIDYSNCPPQQWMTDGVAFGLSPTGVGQPLLSTRAEQPLTGIARYGAARRDLLFKDLKLAPGSMNDQGKLANWQRAGQSVRTPTFTVEDGPVHYLVSGAGRAMAVVDSHRMVNGPLHGQVLFQWNDGGDGRPRWVTQNLSRYVGHRAHVEFSPRDDAPMEVLMVAQGPRPPEVPLNTGGKLLHDALSGADLQSLPSIAGAYLKVFSDVSRALGEIGAAGVPPDRAALADWMVKHPQLFIASDGENHEELREAGARFVEEQAEVAGKIKNESRVAMAMWDGSAENERLLIRGNHSTPGDPVPRRFLTALGGKAEEHAPPARGNGDVHSGEGGSGEGGSGRLELARQVVDPANPLTARVMANRVWHHLTGRGIVLSCDNFGVLGHEPTHPQLLDHLATRFVREGWSIKRLIKAVVLSRTYQMSSRPSDAGQRIDPANKLLHRMRIRRLEGEALRDAMLAVSGRLDEKMHGPPVPVHLTPFMTGRGRPGQGPLDGHGRRSIYISVRRNFLSPMMLAFDVPQPASATGRRTVSNVPAQALILMNDPFVVQQAEQWAKRLLAEQDRSAAERIETMYVQAFARPPTADETTAALAFLKEQAARYGLSEEQATTSPQAWADLCHVMFNVKEFIFIN